MAFYDLPKTDRAQLVADISNILLQGFIDDNLAQMVQFSADGDTYIRKSVYICVGRIYFAHHEIRQAILNAINLLLQSEDFKVRQTMINTAGEIGKVDFGVVESVFDKGLFDRHHSPRNAVIGSIKKMGEVNPVPVLVWSRKYLHHPDKEIRREICHGIELRGRKHPEDILPLLQELQHDKTKRVRWTLVHVIGQIAYKKGCLEKVIAHLKQ